jgi:hypothetical protein
MKNSGNAGDLVAGDLPAIPITAERFFDPVKRRPCLGATDDENRSSIHQACATHSPSGGSAHFPQRAENAG